MINQAGECTELMRLHILCWQEMNELGNGLNTMWVPVDWPEENMRAIPEHAKWYRRFNRHKLKCVDCKAGNPLFPGR